MYAVTDSGYRCITSSDDLLPGETFEKDIPESTLSSILAAKIRNLRDSFLRSCDWTVGADAPLTADQVTVWKTYRQALRDLPAQPGFPSTIEWPVPPDK